MKPPKLTLLEPSRDIDEAMLVIDGYLSRRKASAGGNERWANALRSAGWRGALYHMWWDASDVEIFLARILLVLAVFPLPAPGKLASVLLRSGVSMTAVLAHWIKIRSRAEQIGRDHLPPMLSQIPHGRVSVVGFSLGALILYHALVSASGTNDRPIQDAVLLSGAVPHGEPECWARALAGLEGRLVNVYNPRDAVLKYLFRIAQMSSAQPCGLRPVGVSHPRLFNVRAESGGASAMLNHWGQIDTLPVTVGWLFRQKPWGTDTLILKGGGGGAASSGTDL